MPLFDRFHLSQEEAEARLNRTLTGDPTRGEIALIAALNLNRLDDVQTRLAHDNSLAGDLRALVADVVAKAKARWETRKLWQVTLPLPVWEEYAHEARVTGKNVSECLAAAIRRDYDLRRGAQQPLAALDQHVREFHSAASALLAEGRRLVHQLDSVQALEHRLGRIEAALTSSRGR
jgi:hypothetical protein